MSGRKKQNAAGAVKKNSANYPVKKSIRLVKTKIEKLNKRGK